MTSRPEPGTHVRLTRPREGWPVGTVGLVRRVLGARIYVEVRDDDGYTLDLLEVPRCELAQARVNGGRAGATRSARRS